jgi:hypothetical protein
VRIKPITLVKIGDVTYNAAPVPVNPNLPGVAAVYVFSRRDGSDPVVLCGLAHGWACSCGAGLSDAVCVHVEALRAVGLAERPEPPRASVVESAVRAQNGLGAQFGGFLKSLFGAREPPRQEPGAALKALPESLRKRG